MFALGWLSKSLFQKKLLQGHELETHFLQSQAKSGWISQGRAKTYIYKCMCLYNRFSLIRCIQLLQMYWNCLGVFHCFSLFVFSPSLHLLIIFLTMWFIFRANLLSSAFQRITFFCNYTSVFCSISLPALKVQTLKYFPLSLLKSSVRLNGEYLWKANFQSCLRLQLNAGDGMQGYF